jgi:hypothetical protein
MVLRSNGHARLSDVVVGLVGVVVAVVRLAG